MINPESVFDFCIEQAQCHLKCFKAQWTVPSQLPYFEGHFPGNPVLPAVAIIDATSVFLRQALAADRLKVSSIKSAKFTGIVTPNATIEIGVHQLKDGNEWLTEWKSDSGSLLASITLTVL